MNSNRQLKIGFILDTSLDPPDGVQQYVIGLGGWLTVQGHEVHYLVGDTRERQLPNLHSLTRNIQVSFNGNRTTIPLCIRPSKVRQLMQDEHFDILHVQTPHHPCMAARLINRASPNVGVVATFHILPFSRLARVGTRALGFLLRRSLRRVDAMLAVSRSAAEFEKTSFGYPVQILPNVVDFSRFNSAIPIHSKNKRLTILFLGRLVERKGCLALLQAVANLKKTDSDHDLPAFNVIICGKGHMEGMLRNFVYEQGLEACVTFTGFVSEGDKPRYYKQADIAVFPSSGGESFGIVLLEAMAAGTAAVLAGDNPGYHTVMEPRPELLFDPQDVQQLTDKLRYYLTHDTERRAAAKWGEQYAAEFDIPLIGRKLVKIYNNVLRERRNMR